MLDQSTLDRIKSTRQAFFWNTNESGDELIQSAAKQVISRELTADEIQQVKDSMEASNVFKL